MTIQDSDFASSAIESPAAFGAAITPHDTNNLATLTRAIYVGGPGDLTVTLAGGDTVTLTGVLAGAIYPLRCKKVLSTGTSATSLIALW